MRVAWVMKLKPGCEEAYKKKHDEIWPEMLEFLRRRGIRNYSIYRYGLLLFAYHERDVDAPDPTPGERDPVLHRWWTMMADYMETNPDLSPVMEPVELVFRMD